jgi:hypothetical protein
VAFACVVFVGAAAAVAASTPPTYLFVGKKNVGYIQDGNIQCVYEGAQAERKGRRLIISSALGSLMLIGYQVNANRWAVRAVPYQQDLRGVIVRRTASRWQLWRGHRKLGYAVGPEALEGAAALLSPC